MGLCHLHCADPTVLGHWCIYNLISLDAWSILRRNANYVLTYLCAFLIIRPLRYARIAVNGEEEAITMSRVISFFLIGLYLQVRI